MRDKNFENWREKFWISNQKKAIYEKLVQLEKNCSQNMTSRRCRLAEIRNVERMKLISIALYEQSQIYFIWALQENQPEMGNLRTRLEVNLSIQKCENKPDKNVTTPLTFHEFFDELEDIVDTFKYPRLTLEFKFLLNSFVGEIDALRYAYYHQAGSRSSCCSCEKMLSAGNFREILEWKKATSEDFDQLINWVEPETVERIWVLSFRTVFFENLNKLLKRYGY